MFKNTAITLKGRQKQTVSALFFFFACHVHDPIVFELVKWRLWVTLLPGMCYSVYKRNLRFLETMTQTLTFARVLAITGNSSYSYSVTFFQNKRMVSSSTAIGECSMDDVKLSC